MLGDTDALVLEGVSEIEADAVVAAADDDDNDDVEVVGALDVSSDELDVEEDDGAFVVVTVVGTDPLEPDPLCLVAVALVLAGADTGAGADVDDDVAVAVAVAALAAVA